MTTGQFILQAILWTLSGLFVLQQVVNMTRTKAPKRNRRLGPPSIHCERTGQFEVQLSHTVFGKKQAN